jgi:hypothetical protein
LEGQEEEGDGFTLLEDRKRRRETGSPCERRRRRETGSPCKRRETGSPCKRGGAGGERRVHPVRGQVGEESWGFSL